MVCPGEECNEQFNSNNALQNHFKENHESFQSESIPSLLSNVSLSDYLECYHCGEFFTVQSDLENHEMEYHPPMDNGVTVEELPCSECAEIFHNQSVMNCHIQIAHPEVVLNCEHCDKTFLDDSDLKEHVVEEHTNVGQLFCNAPVAPTYGKKRKQNLSELNIDEYGNIDISGEEDCDVEFNVNEISHEEEEVSPPPRKKSKKGTAENITIATILQKKDKQMFYCSIENCEQSFTRSSDATRHENKVKHPTRFMLKALKEKSKKATRQDFI